MDNRQRSRSNKWLSGLVIATGAVVITVATIYMPPETEKWGHVMMEVVRDFGIALIVAGVIAVTFDWWYHRSMFGEPIEEIQERVNRLSSSMDDFENDVSNEMGKLRDTISSSNDVLKAAQAVGISAIYRRNTSQEKVVWTRQILSLVGDAEEFIFIMGRTLDEILPRNPENGLEPVLRQKIKTVPVIVLLANTFDREADFRIEALDRAGDDAGSLYMPSRHSLTLLLKMAKSTDTWHHLSIRLLKKGPPFAMFMTEKRAIIEPYLPFLDGGKGVVFEVQPNSGDKSGNSMVFETAGKNLYDEHKTCFSRLHMKGEEPRLAIEPWKLRHPDEPSHHRYDEIIELAIKMEQAESKAAEVARLYT